MLATVCSVVQSTGVSKIEQHLFSILLTYSSCRVPSLFISINSSLMSKVRTYYVYNTDFSFFPLLPKGARQLLDTLHTTGRRERDSEGERARRWIVSAFKPGSRVSSSLSLALPPSSMKPHSLTLLRI